MEKKDLFNEDVQNYDRWRPRYCPELFSAVFGYSGAGAGSRVLEVGIGTGQATEPFLAAGCSVTAVEYGGRLADYCRQKFKAYPRFQAVNLPFETFEAEDNSFDLIYSATAFHWIPEKNGYSKAFSLLKRGGTLALFWNRPFVGRAGDPLHQSIQALYKKYRPGGKPPKEDETDRYCSLSALKRYGFAEPAFRQFHQTRRFRAEDYVCLLNTYSDHRAMPDDVRTRFECEIRATIEKAGGFLKVYDTIDLYLAQKP